MYYSQIKKFPFMQKITKLLTVLLLFFLSLDSFTQTIAAKAGLNLSTMLIKDNNSSNDPSLQPGFHLGATADFPISDVLSFETGVLLMTKGYNQSLVSLFGQSEIKFNTLYLDIPLTAKASFEFGKMKAYGQLGPYLGIGLTGKGRLETTILGETTIEEERLEWGDDEIGFKRLDLGLFAGAGIEFNRIQVGLFYSLGLIDISVSDAAGLKANNRVLGISLGYVLSEGK